MKKSEVVERGVMLLDRAAVRDLLDMDEAIEEVARGYAELAAGTAVVPPVVNLVIPDADGELDVKTGYSPRMKLIGVKAASGFYRNRELHGLPTGAAAILLFDGETGFPLAVMDGGYITTVRTGAAGAVAARHLARAGSETACILGAGTQGKIQLLGLAKVLSKLRTVFVHDADPRASAEYVKEMTGTTGLDVRVAASLEEAVRRSDIVVTATPSRSAQIERAWVRQGTHLNAIGSDGPGKQELDPAILRDARVVADSWAQAKLIGECQHAVREGFLAEDGSTLWAEIGEITGGRKSGRQSEEEITVFDATGVAILDVVTAGLVYGRALERGSAAFFPLTKS